MESFLGLGNVKENRYRKFSIMVRLCYHCYLKTILYEMQDPKMKMEVQVSTVGSQYEHINLLGMDVLRQLNLSIKIDFFQNTVFLEQN